MKYFKKIQGERIYLSPINPEDVEKYTKWMNDPLVTKNLHGHSKYVSLLTEKEYLEKAAKGNYSYAIVLEENDELIGNISLMSVRMVNGTAELGIMIGEEDMRGKGYGTEAIKLLMEYAFDTLNLRNIMLRVVDRNVGGLKSYEKAGFKKFGEWESSFYVDGEYHNIIFMNISRD
jgi:RimJ/RimL family protein N-acetyltransferase